jgi:hypothetical protein
MKINGRILSGPAIETLVFPRSDGDIVFRAQGVASMDPFTKLCPVPKPPVVVKPGGEQSFNLEDETYKSAIEQHVDMRSNWLVLQSLKATSGLEWDTVKDSDCGTWANWKDELQQAGFCEAELMRILNLVMVANSLDDRKLEEARKRFLASQEKPAVA